MFARMLSWANWRRVLLLAALVVGVGLFAGGVSAQTGAGKGAQGVGLQGGRSGSDVPQTADAFLYMVPDTVTLGNCPAPPNGGSVTVGCRFVLNLMLNAGTNAAPNGLTQQQSYMTFTYQTMQNARVSSIGTSCVPTTTITGDVTTFDATLQNEVCNGPNPCNFRGVAVAPGSFAFASGALHTCPEGCPDPNQPPPFNQNPFRVAQVGLCAVAYGTALMHWQFSPPAPPTRDTEIVALSGDLTQNPALFTDYVFNIALPNTPTPTITPTYTPAPIPSCGVGSDYIISQASGSSIVSGTVLIVGTQCDECLTNIPLPFTYNLYGIPFYSANLSPNGNMQFTTTSPAFTSSCLPYPPFDYSIMPYWEDLDTSPGITSSLGVTGIFSSITGTSPNRVFNLEWRACLYNGGQSCADGVNFEVRLFEGQDRFDIVYGALRDNGDAATVGAQRRNGSGPYGSFTQFSCSAAILMQGLQLSFTPQPPCPSSTPAPTSTLTSIPTETNTSTETRTPTPTSTPTFTYTPTPSFTPTFTYTPTHTPTPTPTPLLIGHVTWQGRPAQPNTLQQLPITLTLKLGTTEVNYPAQNTDASGFFTVPVTSLSAGTYSWRVKGPKFLASAGTLALPGAGRTNAEMGSMRAGDCNNDNVVNISDFTVIKNSFGKSSGDPGYDDRGDLNGDHVVGVSDVNLVKTSFGFVGPPPISMEK